MEIQRYFPPLGLPTSCGGHPQLGRKDFWILEFSSSSLSEASEQHSVQMFAPEIILPVHYLCPACLDRERAGGA